MTERPEKFATQAPHELLAEVRDIARTEGRQFQAVVAEALAEYVTRKRGSRPRPEVLAHFEASFERNRELYRRLAE
ncbi:MAG TPA: hypothetical protein VNU01_08285 [Egibacteraceae bacterium]|nr:hypothetical protein [Egibacteraceae bacterium]